VIRAEKKLFHQPCALNSSFIYLVTFPAMQARNPKTKNKMAVTAIGLEWSFFVQETNASEVVPIVEENLVGDADADTNVWPTAR